MELDIYNQECLNLQEELKETLEQLDQLKEQIKYQNNFIYSLLKATNNSEWLDKSILDDEAGEIIEKIELDYVDLDQLKSENERLEDLYDRVLQTLKDIEIITQQGIDFFNETERHADWRKVAIFMKQQLYFILGEIEEG